MDKIEKTIEYMDEADGDLLEAPLDVFPGAAVEILRRKINEIIDYINEHLH